MGLLLGTVAFANVPDPVNSQVKLQFNATNTITEPTRIVNVPVNGPSPQNRCELDITVKDAAGTLINNARVWVIFTKASTDTICWCDTQNQTTSVLGDGRREFHANTDAAGFVEFQISAGGCVDAAGVVVIRAGAPGTTDPALAIQLRAYNSIASMDNTGAGGAVCDGAVNLADLQKYGVAHIGGAPNYSTCHDYNADGLVNLADLQLYGQHHARNPNCTHTGPKW
jgi:hypothetical protein